jgi:hypothetical protein
MGVLLFFSWTQTKYIAAPVHISIFCLRAQGTGGAVAVGITRQVHFHSSTSLATPQAPSSALATRAGISVSVSLRLARSAAPTVSLPGGVQRPPSALMLDGSAAATHGALLRRARRDGGLVTYIVLCSAALQQRLQQPLAVSCEATNVPGLPPHSQVWELACTFLYINF